jgi:hypothetical protein
LTYPRCDALCAYPRPSRSNRLIFPTFETTYSSSDSKKSPRSIPPAPFLYLCAISIPKDRSSDLRHRIYPHATPTKEWPWPPFLAHSQPMTQPSTGFPSSRHSVRSATEFDCSSRSLLLPDLPHNLLTTPSARRLGHGCGLVWATECTLHAGTKLYAFSSAAGFIN